MNAVVVVTLVLLAGTGCIAVEERNLLGPILGTLDKTTQGLLCNLTANLQTLVSIDVCNENTLQILVGVLNQQVSALQSVLPAGILYDTVASLLPSLTGLTCLTLGVVKLIILVILTILKALISSIVC